MFDELYLIVPELGTQDEIGVFRKTGPEKRFVITANKESEKHIYVKKVLLNGKLLDRSWITHEEIMNGGTLEFVLDTQIPDSL